MYRNSLKYSSALKANLSTKSLIAPPKFPISSYEVTVTSDVQQNQKLSMYNLIGKRQANSAFIELNRDHKYNTLSKGVISDLKRFIQTYEGDDLVTATWLQNTGKVFSKGMDMKYILHKVHNKEQGEAYDYLKDVYEFAQFFGSYNKPLVILLDGEVSNAAASIFTQRPHVLSTPKSSWALNETSFGYITDCGASYYLSRLPNEVGTYLALTGKKLSSKDMESLHLSFSHTDRNLISLKREFTERNSVRNRPTSSFEVYGDVYARQQADSFLGKLQLNDSLQNEFNYRTKELGENPKLVLAEIQYKQEVIRNANNTQNAVNPDNRKYFDKQPLLNHTVQFESTILDDLELIRQQDYNCSLPFEAISRCFRGKSVEEIVSALEQENSDWARETLQSLKEKSPMSLKLTLRLIREGIRSEWGECFSREYRVACRRINDEEFKRASEARLVDKKAIFADWTHKDLKKITDDQVNQYFAPLDVDLKTPEYESTLPQHALAPLKPYYKEIPDVVRSWFNKQSINDVDMRQNSEFDVRTFLYEHGVELKNPSVEVDLVREKFFKMYEYRRRLNVQCDRLLEIARSRDGIQSYYDTRSKYIEEFFKDVKKADEAIQRAVVELFDEKFEENTKKKEEFATNARQTDKKETFRSIEKIIRDSRLTTSLAIQPHHVQRIENLSHSANIPLFFPHNPYESFLDVPNPELSAIHPYAKYAKNVKTSRKLGYQHMEAFMKGAIPNEELYEYNLEGDHSKSRIPPEHNLTETLGEWVYEHKDEKIAARIKDVNTRFGEDPEEIERKTQKTEEMLELLQSKQSAIAEMLEAEPELKQYVIDTLKKGDLSEKVSDVEVTIQTLIAHTPKEQIEKAEQEAVERSKNVLNKTFDTLLNTTNFVDLQPEELREQKIQPKTLAADKDEVQPDSQNTYEKQLFSMVRLDERLADILKPILNPSHAKPAHASFADSLRKLLNSIYKQKVDKVLDQEQKQFGNIRPLFTKDGERIYSKGNSEVTEGQFMDSIDDYISNNVLFEFNRYVSSHVFFAFSYFGLLELEKMYYTLSSVIGSAQRRRGEEGASRDLDFELVKNLLKEKNVKINSKEELNAFLSYLNDVSSSICQLFYIYKDQLHFTEDLLLEKYMKIKYTVSRYNAGLRNKRNFVNAVLENYKDQLVYQQDINQITNLLEGGQSRPQPNEDAYKLAMMTPEEITDQNKDVYLKAVAATQAYYSGANKERSFIPGSFTYLIELEKATKKAIYGKFNGLPVDLDVPEAETKIPDYFSNTDLREPLPEWFNRKLKDVIKQYLEERAKFQNVLGRDELIALDQELSRLLKPENLKDAVYGSLENDISELRLFGETLELIENNKKNISEQINKTPNHQKEFNKRIKNHEALNKFVAFGISLYDKYRHKKTKKLNSMLLTVRAQMLERMFKEAFEEPKPLSDMSEFTQGIKEENTKDEEKKRLEELKILRENDINKPVTTVLKALLEETTQRESRGGELKKDLEELFRRHDLSK